MPSRRIIFHWFRIAALTALAILLLLFVATKIEMTIFRYRAQQLMADMHQIRLYQSTWTDAQKLMTRWGARGHYDGICTPTDCRYSIQLGKEYPSANRLVLWLLSHGGFAANYWLDDRYPRLKTTWIVRDGKIVRTTATIGINTRPRIWEWQDYSYDLVIITKSRQRLRQTKSDWWIMGSDDDLAEHPYYKAGRPGGCTFCKEAVVTYSTYAPPAEIERLTSFNFSCLTRLIACTTLPELLPAAKDWHLYDDDWFYAKHQKLKTMPPKPCDIPLWALARDQSHVFVVDALSTAMKKGWDRPYEVAEVRIIADLKGTLPWQANTVLKAVSFSGEFTNPPFEKPEHLEAGRRYIVLPVEDERGMPIVYGAEQEISLLRCGVQDNTIEVRQELEKGFSQNDDLRGPELR